MNNHYYTQNPDVIHQERTWNFELRGHNFKFTTDNGVFSKQSVDYGSRVLFDSFDTADLPTDSTICSTRVFHSPQFSHFPDHLG